MATYKSTGVIDDSTDYKSVKWVGTTKGGKACTITLTNAINLGNVDWTFAEKNDTVAQIVFTACYANTNAPSTTTEAPYTVEIEDGVTEGAGEILLGAGLFYLGETAVGLTRGGGKFTSTREFRRQNADGDRGPVKGRIVLEGEEATLEMNVLQILTNVAELYPAIG